MPDPSCTDGVGGSYTCGGTWSSPSGCECACVDGKAECDNCPTGCDESDQIGLDPNTCNTCDCWSGECTSISCEQGCLTHEGPYPNEVYIDGDRFLNDDGCVTACVDGQLVTDEQCVPPGMCEFERFSFLDGESFIHPLNFCDTCTCADGVVECIEVDCYFCRWNGRVYPPHAVVSTCECGSRGFTCLPPI